VVEPRTEHSKPSAAMASHHWGLRAERRWWSGRVGQGEDEDEDEGWRYRPRTIWFNPRPCSPSTPPSCHLQPYVLLQQSILSDHSPVIISDPYEIAVPQPCPIPTSTVQDKTRPNWSRRQRVIGLLLVLFETEGGGFADPMWLNTPLALCAMSRPRTLSTSCTRFTTYMG
jgi:hypothetical protein